jgi:hypothetical protein
MTRAINAQASALVRHYTNAGGKPMSAFDFLA